jgi:hypothetical protein
MNESNAVDDVFARVARALLLCFAMSMAVLLFWFGVILLAGDLAFRIHSSIFEISRHDFDVMNYYGMAFVKMCAFMFFLFPYIAVKAVSKKSK